MFSDAVIYSRCALDKLELRACKAIVLVMHKILVKNSVNFLKHYNKTFGHEIQIFVATAPKFYE